MRQLNKSSAVLKIKKVKGDSLMEADDMLAVEEPLEIVLAYGEEDNFKKKVISVTMRTPGNDEELATGFLFTEGIIKNNACVKSVNVFDENKILVTMKAGEIPVLQNTERNFYTTSSCGVCGKAGIDAVKTVSIFENITSDLKINAAVFYSLPDKLRDRQITFNSTGGLHASALFDAGGNFMMLREDVGRHNALDKIIGTALKENKLPLTDIILLLSGRASFELVQKATMAGIKIIAAIGAPSSLAVQLAEEAGITLIGFLKENGFNIYSGNSVFQG